MLQCRLLLRSLCPTLSAHANKRLLRNAFQSFRNASSTIFDSPFESLAIPNTTLWHIAEKQAHAIPDKVASQCAVTNEKVTFKQLFENAKSIACGLETDGIQRGDVVLLHSPNCLEYMMITLALNALGVICSPASPLLKPAELATQLTCAKATTIITNRSVEHVSFEAAQLVASNTIKFYTFGEASAASQHKSISEFIGRGYSDWKWTDIFDSDTVRSTSMLPFSSGTTGLPKGVMLSHRNIVANVLQVSQLEKLGRQCIGVLPFYHIYGSLISNMALHQGRTNVILPKFDPEVFLRTVSSLRMEKIHIAPPIALFLANHPMVDRYDLSATKVIVSGGAPLGHRVESLLEKRLSVIVKQGYGLTESSPLLTINQDDTRKKGSAGRVVANTQLRVRCTSSGDDLEAGGIGELLFRGPQVMQGYLNEKRLTEAAFVDGDYLRTGDVGYIDENGFVFILDRSKELIKYRGYQVAPAELEDILNLHPDILDSCCVRAYDKNGEEIPKAYVVLRDQDIACKKSDILDFVAGKVAAYKRLRAVEFTDSIPRSPTGKILRRILQERENVNK